MSSARRSYIISGIFICLLGAICFSAKAIFVKLAYRDTGIDAVPLLALRMIFSLPFFLVSAVLALWKTNNIRFTTAQCSYISHMCSYLYAVCRFYSYLCVLFIF